MSGTLVGSWNTSSEPNKQIPMALMELLQEKVSRETSLLGKSTEEKAGLGGLLN